MAGKATPAAAATMATKPQYAAGSRITILGTTYEPGQPIDTSDMADHKIAQLLNQRKLRPMAPTE